MSDDSYLLSAFVARWLPGEVDQPGMLRELVALAAEMDPATKALVAGYGMDELREENKRLKAEVARLQRLLWEPQP